MTDLCRAPDCGAEALGTDRRCFGHTTDGTAVDRGVAELQSGKFVTFTTGMRVEGGALHRIFKVRYKKPLAVDFSRAVFVGDAVFSGARFGRVIFTGARFNQLSYFHGCEFREDAEFENATFMGDVTFATSAFLGFANFTSTVFEAAVDFKLVNFGNEEAQTTTLFTQARFEGRAEFDHVQMTGTIDFDEATMSDRVRLTRVSADGPYLSFRDVTFHRYVDLWVDSENLDLSRARFLAGGQIQTFGTRIDLDEAQFSSPVTITSPPNNAARISSLQGADVGGLLLSGVDLHDCRFRGSHNLDRLRMEASTFAIVGWRKGFARRRVIAEEVHWRRANRRSRGWRGVEGVSEEDDELLEPSIIASIYRNLRKGREDSKDEPGAADFYYGEMEMRRHDNTRSAGERLVVLAYWLLSGYGLRASRALAALALVLLLATASFDLCGFAFTQDPYGPNQGGTVTTTSWDSCRPDHPGEFAESLGRFDTWVFATSAALAVIPRPEVVLTTQGQAIRLVLRILGPLLIGLAFLSLRGRVKR